MKKLYMAPAIEMVVLETESQMMTVSGETDNVGTGSGDAEGGPGMANERRGGWGDLWN